MKRHLELGLEGEALEVYKGPVLGCSRLGEQEEGDWHLTSPRRRPQTPCKSGGPEATILKAMAGEPTPRGS